MAGREVDEFHAVVIPRVAWQQITYLQGAGVAPLRYEARWNKKYGMKVVGRSAFGYIFVTLTAALWRNH